MKNQEVSNEMRSLLRKKIIKLSKDDRGTIYGTLAVKADREKTYPLYSNEFKKALQKIYFEHCGEVLPFSDISYAIETIEVIGMDEVEGIETCKRVYNNGTQYAYELNAEERKVVWIEGGQASVELIEGIFFRHSANYADQILPNMKAKSSKLLNYIRKHFNVATDKEVKLLALFLVTSLWGLNINHPILIVTGEKGSSKSTTLRKLERLIDPKNSDLGAGIPKGTDGLELRLSNSYLVTLDNLSFLNRRTSDTLAVAVTGGSFSKRALYQDSAEIVLDLKAVIIMDSVSAVARESDLLDRSLLMSLKRLTSKDIVTEEELWTEFEKDRADILGCCFQVLAKALNDKEPVNVKEKIRMADFHVACIKAGRAMGIPEDEVSKILWENQANINRHTLDEDIVALCVITLMEGHTEYYNSVSGLLSDLQDIAIENAMTAAMLPKSPNHLRMRLDKIKSNLAAEYGIAYEVKNIGAFKEIHIIKGQ